MAAPLSLTTARSFGPRHDAGPELFQQGSPRTETIRLGAVAAVAMSLAMVVAGLAEFVGTHLLAAWWLERLNGTVRWDIDEANWRQGGVTSVSSAPRSSQPGDGDLNHLRQLRRVVSLNLGETSKITSKGLAALRGLDFLSELNLDRLTRYRHPEFGIQSALLTDACVVHLQVLPRLQNLSLAGNLITDRGLSRIAKMAKLKVLDLSATEVTDGGLVHLDGMKNLETVSLGATRVTKEGVASLRIARPDLSIEFDVDPAVEQGVKLIRGTTQ